jgi:hypothetical protein
MYIYNEHKETRAILHETHIVTFLQFVTFSWYGHNERANNERIPKKTMTARIKITGENTWER